MRFNELKKYKDGRVVKPRDPNWKQMQDLKKSGASGSHGDKTKEIPRKAKYKDKDIEESPIKQDKDNPIAKPYVDTPEWKALHDMDDKIIQAYNKHKKSVSEGSDDRIPRLLGIAQAHLDYGLDMAKNILDGKVQQAENMARIVVESWPEAIDRIQNVYKRDGMYTDAEHISEFIDDRVGTVVKTTQGKRVKIVRADPKAGMYKVDLGNGHEKWVTTKQLDLEVPTDALGKKAKPRDWKHPWDIGEAKEKMCPEACCGVPVSECHCPPDCPHCDCNAIKEDLDSPSHKAQSSIWHKNNPIGRNFMDPDDYDSDARGTHIIMDNPTELHFYKVPAKNYDEAFDKWLDGKNSDRVQDHEFYDSTKDYASDHQYWGRIAPENDTMNWPDDDPDREDDDDWSDEDEKEFGTAARDLTNVPGRKYDADDDKEAKDQTKDEKESLTTEQIAEILEADFGVKDIEDYKAKIKTLYGLERYMQSDPELAQEVKRRYRQLAAWKVEYDKEHEEDYETQIYDAIKTETATAGSTSAGNIATVVNPTQAYGHRPKDKKGLPKAPQKKKADGTAVNALDMGNNLMGGATVKR